MLSRTLQKLVKHQIYCNKIFAIHLENMATFEWIAFWPHNVFYGIYQQGLTTATNQPKLDPWNNTICYNEKPHLLCVSDRTEMNPTCILLNSRGHCCSLFCFSSCWSNVPEHEAFMTLSQDRQFDKFMHFISTVEKK